MQRSQAGEGLESSFLLTRFHSIGGCYIGIHTLTQQFTLQTIILTLEARCALWITNHFLIESEVHPTEWHDWYCKLSQKHMAREMIDPSREELATAVKLN